MGLAQGNTLYKKVLTCAGTPAVNTDAGSISAVRQGMHRTVFKSETFQMFKMIVSWKRTVGWDAAMCGGTGIVMNDPSEIRPSQLVPVRFMNTLQATQCHASIIKGTQRMSTIIPT
jgi:hypothetical protein